MEPPSSLNASSRFPIVNRSGVRIPLTPLRRVLGFCLPHDLRPVEVLLTDDAEIQSLNLESRGLNEPTDVLTFPAPDFPHAPLGEIVVSVPYATRQARERRITRDQEIAYLLMHGCLHLQGFHDENDADRLKMFAEMHRLGLELGLPEQTEWASILHGVPA